jgi:hypothetical protein
MGTQALSEQRPAMSTESEAPPPQTTVPGGACATTLAADDDDVTVVVERGFPRLSYSRQQVLLRALTMVGIAAVGFAATGVVKVAMAHHTTSSRIQAGPVVTPAAPALAKSATHLPPPSLPTAVVANTAGAGTGPTSVAPGAETLPGVAGAALRLGDSHAANDTRQELVSDNAARNRCRAALAQRNTAAITQACAHALELDASLTAPILAPILTWAMRELERGNVSVAALWARRVLGADEHLADAYLIVGVAEQEAGRASAAKGAYRRYLELAPKGRYARDVQLSLAALRPAMPLAWKQ